MKRVRTAMPAYRSALLRLALAFVTCLAASGYFASITHMAFVAHATCEHGMLVHVQAGAALAPDTTGDTPDRADGTDTLGSDEHDHCAGGTVQPGNTRGIGAAVSVTLHEDPPPRTEAVALSRAPARVPLPPPIPLLLLSPKSSPPV